MTNFGLLCLSGHATHHSGGRNSSLQERSLRMSCLTRGASDRDKGQRLGGCSGPRQLRGYDHLVEYANIRPPLLMDQLGHAWRAKSRSLGSATGAGAVCVMCTDGRNL